MSMIVYMSMSLDAKVIRRHLNSRLQPTGEAGLSRPARGWIRAIRDGLGMTASQLGKRMGVSQPTITQMEHNEVSGSITLATLERAAHALGCRLTYSFVPEEPLETRVTEQAKKSPGGGSNASGTRWRSRIRP